MSEKTKIEWCDYTFNPWEGCTKVSPGCANCYAETRNARFGGGTAPNWGKGKPRRRTSEANWNKVLKWEREAAARFTEYQGLVERREALMNESSSLAIDAHREGDAESAWFAGATQNHMNRMKFEYHRPRVFCASLADWLDDEVPIEWLVDLLDLIRQTPHLDWLLLTKRPENWRAQVGEVFVSLFEGKDHMESELGSWLYRWYIERLPPENVWIGTSVEDNERARTRIPALLDIPAKVRFLSCEPLLSETFVAAVGAGMQARQALGHGGIDWVIVGGESGPRARPFNIDWASWLLQQCQESGAACFIKQLGANPFTMVEGINPAKGGGPKEKVKKPLNLLDKKGGDMSEWPEALRVREFPKVEGGAA